MYYTTIFQDSNDFEQENKIRVVTFPQKQISIGKVEGGDVILI